MNSGRMWGHSYSNGLGGTIEVLTPEGGHTGQSISRVWYPAGTAAPGTSVPSAMGSCPTTWVSCPTTFLTYIVPIETNIWPKPMKPGKVYHLLSRQTMTDGSVHETWYEEGGGTGDVVTIETPPPWMMLPMETGIPTQNVGDQDAPS